MLFKWFNNVYQLVLTRIKKQEHKIKENVFINTINKPQGGVHYPKLMLFYSVFISISVKSCSKSIALVILNFKKASWDFVQNLQIFSLRPYII